MGTRFVSTFECDASDEFKQTYIDSIEEDIVIIKSPVGMPGRAIKNKFIEDVEEGKKQPFKCPYHCIKTCDYKTTPYCIAFALTNAYKGKLDHGFAFAGENAYRVTNIVSVKELIDGLVREYDEAVVVLNGNGLKAAE
jgi:nitronate monooxygenase